MKIKVQLIVCAEDGREEQVQEVAMVEKPHQQIEHLGFTLAEAKQLLATLQQHLVEQQATAFVAARAQCDHCGKALGIKGYHTRTFRTLFGTVTLTSPRLYHCRCQRRKTTTFRPLNALLTERGRPRAAVHGDEVGLTGLLRPDGAGAEGLSPGGCDAQCDHHPEPCARGGPTLRRRTGRGAVGLCGGLSRRLGDPAHPRWPPHRRH